MGACTTRRRPLPVARRHRQGLLCRPVTDRRVPPPARPSVSFSLVLSRLLSAPLQAVICAHVHSAPFVPYQYRISTAPSCIHPASAPLFFCASAFCFSPAGRCYSSSSAPVAVAVAVCAPACSSIVYSLVVRLWFSYTIARFTLPSTAPTHASHSRSRSCSPSTRA